MTGQAQLPQRFISTQRLTLNLGGRERYYLVYLPPRYSVQKPLPVVLMLHGAGGTAEQAIQKTG